MHKFLIVIDMQKDFIDGALGTPEAQAAVPHAVRRIRDAVAEGRTLLFTQDTHHEAYLATSEGRHLPIPHCIAGSDGWRLHEAVAPFSEKEPLQKNGFGATSLVDTLSAIAKDGGTNLDASFIGLCTDICVVSNALLLRMYFPEATLRVYADSCAGVTPEGHDAALKVLRACQVEVIERDAPDL